MKPLNNFSTAGNNFKALGEMPNNNEPYGLRWVDDSILKEPVDRVDLSSVRLLSQKEDDPDMPSTNEPYGHKQPKV